MHAFPQIDDFLNKGISLILAILHPLGVRIDLLLVNRTEKRQNWETSSGVLFVSLVGF